jgi:two-component system, OmpR family, sensor histidine kinase MtrB
MRWVGLRTRVTGGFAVGALVLSASMALVSYQLVRTSLLDERERTAVRAASFNATVVGAGLAADESDVVQVLRSLETGVGRRPMVRRDGIWYARNADQGITAAIPPQLLRTVEDGRLAVQRVRADGQPAVVVGVPLTPSTAFYELDSLQELDRTFRTLTLALFAGAIMIACAGAGLGWYATRYVLRPLASVAQTAEDIAAGHVKTRLDPAAEPDLARLTRSFNHMVDQLAERNERDRRFAADVSHELRSPLQTLSAAVSVLSRRRNRLDERSAAAAGLITDEVERFQRLVNDLIELARTDQPAHRSAVDITDLARRVCRSCGVSGDLVEVTTEHTVWHIDPRRVQQLLTNLVENAVQYGGGPTAVRLGHQNGRYCIEVDDEGPGISPDDKSTIFHRFVRGRAANARGGGDGTGLGLALVAEHAAAHGGTAQVQDRAGGGARFLIELREPPP